MFLVWGKQNFSFGSIPKVGEKQKNPKTRGGSGSRDRTLAVNRRKKAKNQLSEIKLFENFLKTSPSEVSPKWVKSRRRKRRRAKVNDYNGVPVAWTKKIVRPNKMAPIKVKSACVTIKLITLEYCVVWEWFCVCNYTPCNYYYCAYNGILCTDTMPLLSTRLSHKRQKIYMNCGPLVLWYIFACRTR